MHPDFEGVKWCSGLFLVELVSMERSGVKCFHCNHVFDLTNLKGEKRRNIGKQNNELNIINQLAKFYDLPVSNLRGVYTQNA
jgi:peptide subunit release factor 1 (eRF1)